MSKTVVCIPKQMRNMGYRKQTSVVPEQVALIESRRTSDTERSSTLATSAHSALSNTDRRPLMHASSRLSISQSRSSVRAIAVRLPLHSARRERRKFLRVDKRTERGVEKRMR